VGTRPSRLGFGHLHVHTEFSMLDGASTAELLVAEASRLGQPFLAITDHDSVAGVVKFHAACGQYGVQPITGAEVTLEDGSHLTLLAETSTGYANLCQLLTLSFAHGGRKTPRLALGALDGFTSGLLCLTGCHKGTVSSLVRRRRYGEAKDALETLIGRFGKANVYVELQDDWTPGSLRIARELAQLADAVGVGAVATNNVHYLSPDDWIAHDVLRCIAVGCTVDEIHPVRPINRERFVKSTAQMCELFAWRPQAIDEAFRIAERCAVVLPSAENITPDLWGDADAELWLRAHRGAVERYGKKTGVIGERLAHELSVIRQLGYSGYMLMCSDVVAWARAQGIRCTGRGSAADSLVAYTLYLTDIDVLRRDLLFSRFLRDGKKPDVDTDFPSDRRDEVFQHVVDTYGADYVGAVAAYSTFGAKAAIRDIGKVLQFPSDLLSWLSSHISYFVSADEIREAFTTSAELKAHVGLLPQLETLAVLCKGIADLPRHIATHSSGVVISRKPLSTIAPLMPSARGITRIWTLDKDDAEDIGAIKYDILGLRMLSAVSDAEVDARRTGPDFSYDAIPMDDKPTFDVLRSGHAIAAFQFESAAQLSLSLSLLPETFDDLTAAVALIRPGPVKGNVVQRFVDARHGFIRADALHPSLEPILAKTFGCVVFQEQATAVIATMLGITEAEAEKFRKGLKKRERHNEVQAVGLDFIHRACSRFPDLRPKAASQIWDQVKSWGGYGFVEGHAASFALTGYRTAFLSVHHTAEFFAGMLNHTPLGFYSPNSYAAEARRRGVAIRPVSINVSCDKCCAEDGEAIRLGLRTVSGIAAEEIAGIVVEQEKRPFSSLLDFAIRVQIRRDSLESLILAGAFDALHENRRALLFALDETIAQALSVRAAELDTAQEPLAIGWEHLTTPLADIADFNEWDRFLWAWRITGVAADCHPISYLRDYLIAKGFISTYEAQQAVHGQRVRVAGMNIRPHRPPTRSGEPVLFATIEDEIDLLQVMVSGEAIDRCTGAFLISPALMVEGRVRRKGQAVSLNVERAKPLTLKRVAGDQFQAYPAKPQRVELVGSQSTYRASI